MCDRPPQTLYIDEKKLAHMLRGDAVMFGRTFVALKKKLTADAVATLALEVARQLRELE